MAKIDKTCFDKHDPLVAPEWGRVRRSLGYIHIIWCPWRRTIPPDEAWPPTSPECECLLGAKLPLFRNCCRLTILLAMYMKKKKNTHTHTQLCETENLLNTHVFSPCTCLAYRYTVSSEANSEQRLKKWLDRCGLTATWRVTAINSVHTASDSSCYFVYCEAQNVVLYCSLDWSSSAITLSSPITWRWERLFLQSPFDRAARPGRPQNLRA